MISWAWTIPALIVGVLIGMVLGAIIASGD